MARKRPCAVCFQWFRPDPRQGDRQHTCGKPACVQEWHRRNCARWHKRNPGYDQEPRLVSRLVKEDPPVARGRPVVPLRRIDWTAAKALVGRPVAVLVEEAMKVALQRARDAMPV